MERGTTQIDDKGRMSPIYTPYEELRRVAKENIDWPYAREVDQFYRRAPEIAGRFYTDLGDWEGQLPPVVFGVENLRNKNTLAAYHLIPDSVGLPFKISFNEQHYIDGDNGKQWRYGEWAKMETLVHELGHHWQQIRGEDPFTPKSRVTHNKEFTDKMESIGIFCDSGGAHFAPVGEDSPAGLLFESWGLGPPEDVPAGEPLEFDWFKWFADKKGRARPSTSTLRKYVCPECGINVRWGRKAEPELMHVPCGKMLVRG